MWADNADALAKQYAGTGALKTDFTRFALVTAHHMSHDQKIEQHSMFQNWEAHVSRHAEGRIQLRDSLRHEQLLRRIQTSKRQHCKLSAFVPHFESFPVGLNGLGARKLHS